MGGREGLCLSPYLKAQLDLLLCECPSQNQAEPFWSSADSTHPGWSAPSTPHLESSPKVRG